MKDRIKQLIEVDWRELKPIQPEDVKIQNNLEALKSSLKKHGFSLPFAVWIDGTDIYTIDGHTRKKALQELQAEGVEIPDKLKAVEIEAKNRKEAVEILVEVFNQKHNPFDNEVLINWLEVERVEVDKLDGLNLETKEIFTETLTKINKEDKSFEDEANNFTDKNCEYPIVPDFFENHECFIIPCHNSIDVSFVRDLFGLNEKKTAPTGNAGDRLSNVIDVNDLKKWSAK